MPRVAFLTLSDPTGFVMNDDLAVAAIGHKLLYVRTDLVRSGAPAQFADAIASCAGIT
jgi:hypothetical protein